ncbi:MAG: hypothetical protein ACXQTW_08405 [Candidatus Methanospirareceae archaeon]
MPKISNFKCNKCGFSLPSGWGGHMYVENEKGERIPCPHPTEWNIIMEVLKISTTDEGDDVLGRLNKHIKILREGFPKEIEDLIKSRIGFNFDCVCLDCLNKFEADVGNAEIIESLHKRCYDLLDGTFKRYYMPAKPKDDKRCSKCGSANIKTIFELVGQTCPKCKEGIIEEIDTGIIS